MALAQILDVVLFPEQGEIPSMRDDVIRLRPTHDPTFLVTVGTEWSRGPDALLYSRPPCAVIQLPDLGEWSCSVLLPLADRAAP